VYKEFFKLLKAATSNNASPLKKMFITGVSQLALFDVTSGSNIGKNITNELMFNNALGITKAEYQDLIKSYNLNETAKDMLPQQQLDEWYDNYIFNEMADKTIYNTDMILYYVDSLSRI